MKTVDEQIDEINARFAKEADKLAKKHGAEDLWGVPVEARVDWQNRRTREIRLAYGREPVFGEPLPEKRAAERAARAATRAAEIENGEAPRKVRATVGGEAITPGSCEHCGGATKGGRFLAGHDAKLKGILAREAMDVEAREPERVAAVLELIYRGWLKPHHADDDLLALAEAQQQTKGATRALVEQRVKARQEGGSE